jgi:hypothetical protein
MDDGCQKKGVLSCSLAAFFGRFIRLLKNARLLRFPHPSPFNVPESTPHGSGFRGPCIQAFLNSLDQHLVQQTVNPPSP